MVREGALMPVQYDVNANRGMGFRLGESWKARDSGVNYREEEKDKENQYLDTGSRIATSMDEASPIGGKSSVLRHQEAYAHMTKDARPLPPPPRSPELESDADSEPPRSRSPKRRRTGEAVAINMSSSFHPVSVSEEDFGGEEETPGRIAKKVKGCWEDVDADVPLQSLEEQTRFMEIEKLKPPHPLLAQMLEDLRPKFPGHELLVDGEYMKCLECDGKLFKMPIKSNFERHLKSKVHLANMELRRAQGISNPNRYFPPISARTSLGYFSTDAQERVAAFAQPGRSRLSEVGVQFFQMLQNEGNEKSIQLNFLEHRITASEKKKTEQIQAINEKMDDVEKRSMEEIQLLTESAKAAEEHNESEIKEVHVKIDGVDRRLDDRFLAAEEIILELKNSDREYMTAILEMSKAARENEKAEEDFKEKITDRMANFSGKLAMFQQKNKETLDGITGRLAKAEKADNSDKVKDIGQRLRYHKERVDELEGKQRDIKKAMEALEVHAEAVSDLEMQLQMLRDQAKGHSTSEQQMTVANERLQAEFKHTTERLSAVEIENEERQKVVERQTAEKFVTLKKDMGERLADIQQSHTADMEGLLKVFEKQKDKLAAQEELLASTSGQVQRQTDMLERYGKTLELQNQVIKVQNQRLAENDRILKEHSKRLARQEEVSKHLRMTVPAFMTDVQMLNDKIEDHIDESRERDISRETRNRIDSGQASKRTRANPRMKNGRFPRRISKKVMRR